MPESISTPDAGPFCRGISIAAEALNDEVGGDKLGRTKEDRAATSGARASVDARNRAMSEVQGKVPEQSGRLSHDREVDGGDTIFLASRKIAVRNLHGGPDAGLL